jgi:phosphopantothenoylcysteine decarboxylase/phosphopantothenate--cysteine ligase
VTFVGPRMIEGKAKMASQDDIVLEVFRALGPRDLSRKRVLVIAGSTHEPLDDARYLSNRSSGRTGLELYTEAFRRGADVELWVGEGVSLPKHINAQRFGSVKDLQRKCQGFKADIVLVPAAISDFTVQKRKGKSPSDKPMTLKLEKAPRILELLRAKRGMRVVGFKAEIGISTKVLEERARARMDALELDMIVANLLEDVEEEETKVIVLPRKRKGIIFKGDKSELATLIFDALLEK